MSHPIPPLASAAEEIQSLRNSIKLSNNGYLFAPYQHQINVAKANPHIFRYTFFGMNSAFPHKIELV